MSDATFCFGAIRAVWSRQYKKPNRKGIRHQNFCLHDEPGVTICTCNPIPERSKQGSERSRKRGDHVEICIDDTWFESSTCYVVEMEMLNADR